MKILIILMIIQYILIAYILVAIIKLQRNIVKMIKVWAKILGDESHNIKYKDI